MDMVFQGIQTLKGFNLYLQIVNTLSRDNTRKVSAAAIATEWNAQVTTLVAAATSAPAKSTAPPGTLTLDSCLGS